QMPYLRYICASYAESLSIRDNRKCRQLIGSDIYQEMWGDVVQVVGDQDTKGRFENTQRGWKYATSTGGTATGERGDRVILDDPHNIKNVESMREREAVLHFVTEVLPTRVNDPDTAVFVAIMQRTHEHDVSGHILASDMGYEHLCIPIEYAHDHPYKSRTSLHFIDPR